MMEKKSKQVRGRLWRVVRPSLALSTTDESALITSTLPLDPKKALYSMPLQKLSKSRARFILRRLKKYIRILADGSGRFVNLITYTPSISTLYELLKFCLEGNFSTPRPPDAGMFIRLLKQCRIPAKYLKMFTAVHSGTD